MEDKKKYYSFKSQKFPCEVRKYEKHGGFEPPTGMTAAMALVSDNWFPVYVPSYTFDAKYR